MCHDISCLIIRQLEIDKLGITFLSLITLLTVLCSSISFVDDTDLAVDEEQALQQI